MVTGSASTRWSPMLTVALMRRVMWVGEPPTIAAIRSRGTRGRTPASALKRKNWTRIPLHPGRS
jgi:hypothetical protein